MYWWQRIKARIDKAGTSTRRTQDGKAEVLSPKTFRALPLSAQKEITDIVENEQKNQFTLQHRVYDTLSTVQERSANLIPVVLNTVKSPVSLLPRVADAIGYRDFFTQGSANGGISNSMWMSGIAGQDPAKANRISTNLYLSPGEAAAIYSQKGLPEIIIKGKSHSILLNGVKIENPRLSPEQLDQIGEHIMRTGLDNKIADALRDSFVYGGSLLFPFFKKDSPLSMTIPVPLLAKYGVLGKGCIDYWITLDRWNTVHFPQWNPTAKDFLKPEYFYIPYLGCDVHSSRMARVVTAPQPGYWGVMTHMGWGLSDIPGWIESVYNYYNVMQAIPTMIAQMSIIARTFNVDGPQATEGAMVLDMAQENDTIRVREMSVNDPISLDVVGNIQAIQRDFKEVPQLTRLIRQDLAARAGRPEELLFSSEKGAFAGGSDQSASWARQEEHNRILYKEVARQLKPIAQLAVIDAFGIGRDIMHALPYTRIGFDSQKVTDVDERTELLKAATKGFFDEVAGGMPLPDAAEMISQLSGGLVVIDNELLTRLKQRQEENDQREQEKHDAEIKQMLAPPMMSPSGPRSSSPSAKSSASGTSGAGSSKGHSYSDPLEQKKHETTKPGGTKKQGLQKAENKKKA